MKNYKLFIVIILALFADKASTQDMHWTMFDMSPVFLNPAHTGDHSKLLRAGVNYRDQWNSVSNASGYSTATAFVDAPLISAGKNSWIGMGLMLFSDKSGSNRLSNTGVMVSVAAHLKMNKTSVFSAGFQGGYVTRKLDASNLLFEEQINLNGPNTSFNSSLNDGLLSDSPNVNYTDFGLGLKYYSRFNKKSDLTVGVAIKHIASMNNFIESENLPMLFSVHGRLSLQVNKEWSFIPGVNFYKAGNANQINIQALASFSPRSRNAQYRINGGLGYRTIGNDAIMAIAQFEFSSYKFGLSYDLNTSDLAQATNNNGGFEFSFVYTASQKKSFSTKVGCPANF